MKILILEDHSPTAVSLSNLLSSQIEGVEIKIAATLTEGLSAAIEWRADITLLDPGLPDSGENMDHFFNSILKFPPPVIVVTGIPDPNQELLIRSYQSGAQNFFEKRHISGNLVSSIHAAYLRYKLFTQPNGIK